MRNGDFHVRGKDISRVFGTIIAWSAFASACGKSTPAAKSDSTQPAQRAAVAGSGDSKCPATGQWAECSVLYRLERAGLAPRVDSTATPAEKTLTGTALVIKIGLTATLEVHVYADSTARVADAKKLDRTQLIAPGAAQTMNRERLLIENANLIGLFTSLNEHQRERVADALLAGPPQVSSP